MAFTRNDFFVFVADRQVDDLDKELARALGRLTCAAPSICPGDTGLRDLTSALLRAKITVRRNKCLDIK
jgi:hypothetical protein